MTRCFVGFAAVTVLALQFSTFSFGQDKPAPQEQPPAPVDLKGFRTLDQAITVRISLAAPTAGPRSPSYLGIHVTPGSQGLTVSDVHQDSPAAKAGLRSGDILVK